MQVHKLNKLSAHASQEMMDGAITWLLLYLLWKMHVRKLLAQPQKVKMNCPVRQILVNGAFQRYEKKSLLG